ncbi:hypothetical protein [uncultured Psychroserpens sp.]|uniref:hypothetical protein n=1 Tax=uncultured Psychroserpens sp. TaxID=255436 RepID=UPI00260B9EC5|nr:hypothetical protein [uncultured Psychroserpens sp.]
MLILIMFLIGCSYKTETTNTLPKGDFNGLYTVEFEEYDIQYIWIFTDDLHYVLYPGTNSKYSNVSTNISYETPTHYFVKGNKFYTCGIDSVMNETSLADCKKQEKEPRYNIIKIDTIEDSYFKDKYQIIKLEDFYSKKVVELKKRL